MKVVNVASKSSTNDLADIIIASLDDEISLKAIGAGAVNQAVKAIAVASQKSEFALYCKVSFFNVTIDGQEKSGINLLIVKEN